MAVEAQVRVAILTAPAPPPSTSDFRLPPPDLDRMVDFRELRVPRRRSDNARTGDSALPALYAVRLGLATYAAVEDEVGTAQDKLTLRLPEHTLVETASGELTACLAARALAGVADAAPLQGVWFGSAELQLDGAIAEATLREVQLVGYKAMLAARLVRHLHRNHGRAAVDDAGVPVAPFLVSADQDLDRELGSVEGLARREGPEFWPFTIEPHRPGRWTFAIDDEPVVHLDLLPVERVRDAETALAGWAAHHRPPSCVERALSSESSPVPSRPRGRWGAAVAALAIGMAAFAAVSGARQSLEIPARVALGPPPVDASAHVMPGLPPSELHEEELAVTPITEPVSIAPADDLLDHEPVGPKRTEGRAASAPTPTERPRRRHVPPRKAPVSAKVERVRAADVPVSAADPGSDVAPKPPSVSRPTPGDERAAAAPVELRLLTKSGRTVSGRLGAMVEARLRDCLDRGECPSPPRARLEVVVVDNLLERQNPFLEIGDARCSARHVSSCFR